jgi:hypothetical protein
MFYLTTFSVAKIIINWKECGRTQSWSNLKYYPNIYLKQLKRKIFHSGKLVPGPRFEHDTSRIMKKDCDSFLKKNYLPLSPNISMKTMFMAKDFKGAASEN